MFCLTFTTVVLFALLSAPKTPCSRSCFCFSFLLYSSAFVALPLVHRDFKFKFKALVVPLLPAFDSPRASLFVAFSTSRLGHLATSRPPTAAPPGQWRLFSCSFPPVCLSSQHVQHDRFPVAYTVFETHCASHFLCGPNTVWHCLALFVNFQIEIQTRSNFACERAKFKFCAVER